MRAAQILCLLAAFGGQAIARDDAERLRIHGSNTMGDRLVPAMVEDWLRSIEYTGIRRVPRGAELLEIHAQRDGDPLIVEIGKGGSAKGMAALIGGRAELAMMTRAPTARERDAAWQLGDLASPDQEFVIALDGAAVVVDARNPVRRISLPQLRDLLTGTLNNWKQLGGSDQPILVHRGSDRGGLADHLRDRVTGGRPLRPAHGSMHASLRAAAAAVAGHPDALAIVELTTPLPAGTRTLAVSEGGVAVEPTLANIRGEDYPLVRRYTIHGGQMMSALGRSFALHAISPAAQRVVRAHAHIAMALPDRVPQAGETPAGYDDAVAGAVRLPLSLRFNLGSLTTVYDSRSAQDMERLIAWMQMPQNRGRRLAVVGFSDADASSRIYATMTSISRADIVSAHLTEKGIEVVRSRGLGSARPLVPSGGTQARYRNERVEIWMM